MNEVVSSRTFSVPVRYIDRTAKPPLRQAFGTTEVSMRSVTATQVPVVARWWPHTRGQGGQIIGRSETPIEYREFDGRLWAPFRAHWWRPTELRDLMADLDGDDPERWRSVLQDKQDWTRAHDHPLMGLSSRRSSTPGDVFDHDFHVGPSDSPDYLKAVEEIAIKAGRFLLVDDRLWVPSLGPGLRHAYSGGNGGGRSLEFENTCIAADQGHFWTWKNMLSALTVEESIRAVTTNHGRDFPIFGEAPELVGDLPVEAIAEMSDRAMEAAAWHALWMARKQPVGELSREMIGCLMEIRTLLAERWPHKDLDWAPKVTTRIFDHWEDEDVPDARALIDPIERFLGESPHDAAENKTVGTIITFCRFAPRREEIPELDDLKL